MKKIKRNLLILFNLLKKGHERKGFIQIFFEIIYWVSNRGRLFYYSFLELNLKKNNIKNFITEHEFEKMHNKLNILFYRTLLEDKLIFDRFLKSFNFPSPEVIGIVENSNIFLFK